METPKKVITLLEFARRIRVNYSLVYTARKKGLLTADFVDNSGRPLFDPDRLKENEAVNFLRSLLSAEDFDKLKASLEILPGRDTSRERIGIANEVKPSSDAASTHRAKALRPGSSFIRK
jgi:hypothetical protein